MRQTLRESERFPLRIERIPLVQEEEERYRTVVRVERPVNSCERGSADWTVGITSGKGWPKYAPQWPHRDAQAVPCRRAHWSGEPYRQEPGTGQPQTM